MHSEQNSLPKGAICGPPLFVPYFDIVFNHNKSSELNPNSELSSTYLVVQIQATFKNGFVHSAMKKEATPTQQGPPHLMQHFNICVCIIYFCILKISNLFLKLQLSYVCTNFSYGCAITFGKLLKRKPKPHLFKLWFPIPKSLK